MSYLDALFRRKKIANDGGIAGESQSLGSTGEAFPWGTAEKGQRAIGTLFELEIDNQTLTDMYKRYQLARRIIDMPIEEALMFDPTIFIDEKEDVEALRLYKKSRTKWLRFFKLASLYGHSEMIIGFNDDITLWSEAPAPGTQFSWLQPVPIQYEQELKESDAIPKKIEWLTVNFGEQNITLHPDRFIHCMNPKLYEEDKLGESILLPVANMLQVQIHSDWSIGQALWRRAGGLLGIFAPRRKMEQDEIDSALQSVNNHNSKTVVYVPFGWNIKEILRTSGNIAIARTYAVILEQIAAGCGIPLSILTGQKSGGLNSGSEDQETYNRYVASKQNNMIEPVLNKFFRECQKANFLPAGKIEIKFKTLENLTPVEKETEMTEIGALRLLQRRMESEETQPNQFSTDELIKIVTKKRK